MPKVSIAPLLRPPDRPAAQERWRRGAALSVLAHAALVAALAWNVQWHTVDPEGVQAELWAAVPTRAAPAPASPAPAPAPAPIPHPVPTPPPAPPVEPPTPAPPEIVTEKLSDKKREREREHEHEREERKQEQRQKEQQQKEKENEKEKEKEKAAQEKAAAEAKKTDARKADAKKALSDKQLQAQREANLRRIMGQADTTSDSQEADPGGTAARNAGPSATYAGRIKGRIRPNIVLTDEIAGNPQTEVEVHVAPDGRITSRRITHASGVKKWDDAVLDAIDRTAVLPRDEDGRVPPVMVIAFRPNE